MIPGTPRTISLARALQVIGRREGEGQNRNHYPLRVIENEIEVS